MEDVNDEANSIVSVRLDVFRISQLGSGPDTRPRAQYENTGMQHASLANEPLMTSDRLGQSNIPERSMVLWTMGPNGHARGH
jgi:hypothetical protein